MAPSTARGTKRVNGAAAAGQKKVKLSSKKSAPVESASESSESSSSEDELDQSDSDHVLDQSDDSDDELDQASDDEKTADLNPDTVGVDSEDGKSGPVDPNKKSAAEVHAEQRKLLQERKLQRKSGTEVQHIKSLWERLRVKHPKPPKEVREKLCEEIWDNAKDVIRDLVLKHDASRVVQTLVKYTTRERRDAIAQALKTHYYELATSSYGKYLLVKMLHYGSKDSRDLIIGELHGKLRKLMRHREGAYVVEDLFVLYATADQKRQMIREFWGAEYAVFKESGKGMSVKEVSEEAVEKRNLIAKNLAGTITASVEKGSTGFQILHAAMREYVQIINDEEIREFIDLLHEQFAELIHTPEGCEVACTLIARANAKERKLIVKTLREHAIDLIKNEHGNLVLTTLFLTVDDTVMVQKAFQPEFADKMAELVIDKYARRPFLYLLTGLDGRYFSPGVKKELQKYIDLSQQTSKKPQEQRRAELLEKFAPLFYTLIEEKIEDVLQENMGAQFVSEVFLNNAPAEDSQREAAIAKVIEAFQGNLADETNLIFKPFSVRLLKSLIQCGKWDQKSKKLIKLDIPGLGEKFADKFYSQVINESLNQWIENDKTSFVVVALYESTAEKSAFQKDLKKAKKVAKKAASPDNKGAQLLVKLAGF